MCPRAAPSAHWRWDRVTSLYLEYLATFLTDFTASANRMTAPHITRDSNMPGTKSGGIRSPIHWTSTFESLSNAYNGPECGRRCPLHRFLTWAVHNNYILFYIMLSITFLSGFFFNIIDSPVLLFLTHFKGLQYTSR